MNEWKRARWVSYWTYGLGAGEKSKPITQFLPLEGDENAGVPSKDEIAEMKEVFLKAMNTNGNARTRTT